MDKVKSLISNLEEDINNGVFVKIHLNNYKGSEKDLKKIIVKPIELKKGLFLNFTYRYKTKDIAKNYSINDSLTKIEEFLNTNQFHQLNYFSTARDGQYQRIGKNKEVLKWINPSITEKPTYTHDKAKSRKIESNNKTYLTELKITNAEGRVFNHAQDKFKQINHYIEILSHLLKQLPKKDTYKAVDMGSGKGYLTFALYDYLVNSLNKKAEVAGVEYRQDMVDLCNSIAQKTKFNGLGFVQGTIEDFSIEEMDILIALHACDTATDDAIKKGIDANAELIVVAPCCHKQIRRELEKHKPENDLDILTKHGIFLERHAEMLTDGLRAQILEYFGYKTRVFEFIALDHTPKNVLIVAQKQEKTDDQRQAILKEIKKRKAYFGVEQHYLEQIMKV
ncbi:MAG: class I SAM-dependent methyltransferase [Flavobacteriales bacterium]